MGDPRIVNSSVEFAGRHLDRVEVNLVVVRRQLMYVFFFNRKIEQTTVCFGAVRTQSLFLPTDATCALVSVVRQILLSLVLFCFLTLRVGPTRHCLFNTTIAVSLC